MKVTKTVSQPAKDYETTDHLVCELCGKKTDDEDRWPPLEGRYSRNAVEVQHEFGSAYPEGGHIYKTIIDICPECFRDKLIPWVKSQGGKERQEETDW